MDIKNIIIATVVVAIVGLVIAALLSLAEKVFYVKIDPREEKVRDCLGGNNCGACGYAGCDALAKAIVLGEAPVNACPPAGQNGADKIAEIMGVEAEMLERKTAFVACSGTCDKRNEQFNYFGLKSCRNVKMGLGIGALSCRYGCIGYGDCVEVCDNNAISLENGKAVINYDLCGACGKCVKACPQSLIKIVPYKSKYRVQCVSYDKGKAVKLNCDAGCIGCGLCVKNCPKDAIKLENNVAVIDYDVCVGCGLCAKKCPVGVIVKV